MPEHRGPHSTPGAAWPAETPHGQPPPADGEPGPRPGRGARRGATPDGEARQEIAVARGIRARALVAKCTSAQIAALIHDHCGPIFGTTAIRAHRLAQGIALADVVAQVRAWYQSEGRGTPRFSETLLSAYESGQKRPGSEYLHYLCAVYHAEPADLGFDGACFCGRSHRDAGPGGYGSALGVPGGLLQAGLVPAPAGPVVPRQAGAVSGGTGRSGAGAGGSGPRGAGPGDAGGAGAAAGWPSAVLAGPGWPGGARDSRAVEAEDDDDVLRRALLRLIADAGADIDCGFFGAADRIRRRMDDALVDGTVSATMLDQWEETTAGYGRQYMTVPPLRLLCDVLLDFGDVRRMCEKHQPLEFGERLCRLAGRLAGLAGMTMIDIGDQRLARSFFRTARTAADETGDRHLRAWVAVREAMVPLYYGDPREAAASFRAGADLAGRHPSVAGVMAPVLEARALARLAAPAEAGRREALMRVRALAGQAHDRLDSLAAEHRGNTAFGYTERQLLFHEGDALITLGNGAGAERALSRALLLYSPAEFLDRSLVTVGLARCLLEADEPEEALRMSQETVLGVPREHRSEIVVRAARALGDRAAGRHGDFAAVREYREALVNA